MWEGGELSFDPDLLAEFARRYDGVVAARSWGPCRSVSGSRTHLAGFLRGRALNLFFGRIRKGDRNSLVRYGRSLAYCTPT